MNRCGFSETPDTPGTVCGATPSTHVLVNHLDGGPLKALFSCPEHLGRARTAGLVLGEHEYGAACAASRNSRWIQLKGGQTVCIPHTTTATA